jgi:hypothetical protein
MSAKTTTSVPPPAAGVPSGNGKYIAVVLLLLLLVGGLVAWKLLGNKPPPNVATPDAGAKDADVMIVRADDDIPPPEKPDAGIDGGRVQIVYITHGCDSKKCTGTTSTDLEAALAQRARQAHRCYDNALMQDPNLKGKMSIAVRVGSNGTSCSANVASNELPNASVSQCVVGFFRGGAFPQPKGGCVDTVVPINFVNKL